MDERPPQPGAPTLGVDVGGTFTDVVGWDGARLTTAKVSSTPDQSDGVVEGARLVDHLGAGHLLHGSTVATNALLERRGAVTALVTTEGFEDLIEIGRQDRPSLYDGFADRSEPLVPRVRRIGLPPDVAHTFRVVDALEGVEAVAVSLLYGYERPELEAAVAAVIEAARPDIAVSLSSVVSPEFREFERTSTTVLNAYLTPLTSTYLRRLAAKAGSAGLPPDISVMRSSGGLVSLPEAAALPASILLSGPAGGVVAAAAVGAALDRPHLISFDMGGTSTDVCRIDEGRPDVAYERAVEGFPCRLPSVAIHTVGAGGGSIAWVDAGGSLRVGPQSAGATPGPAAYDRGGTAPTVTDANIVLGRIDPSGRLAGRLALRADRAIAALASLGRSVGLSPEATASGVLRVVEEVMAGAIRTVSIEQGADPREATLVAFGGAGGLHATALARSLEMAAVVIPPYAGVFSALGLLLSPPRVDRALTVLGRDLDAGASLDEAVTEVATRARASLVDMGEEVAEVVTLVDVRYAGQAHELAVPYETGSGPAVLRDGFDRLHLERNGFARWEDPVEMVTVRAEVVGRARLEWSNLPEWRPEAGAHRKRRTVVIGDEPVEADVWWRPGLAPGLEIIGPAVIEEPEATTFLATGETGRVHESGAIEITW